jgi:calcineurin-like phosphoesterase family protein
MVYLGHVTHFGHVGSLHWPNGNARDFPNIQTMNQTIVDNWNSIVTDEDIVYCLGDFSYKTSTSTIKHIFQSLKGKIILIKGNHDGQTLKANQQVHRFESVHDLLEIDYKDIHFVLCHYPMESWRLKEKGSIHLHGHTHGGKSTHNMIDKPNRMDVSVEAINYTPISIEEVLIKLKHEK